MKILHKVPLLCFALTILILTSTASAKSLEAEYNLQHSQSSISQQKISQPQHLLLNALDLQEKGYLARALAKLSEAYGEESILTENYYSLIDRKRRAILNAIENGDPWAPGAFSSKKTLQSFKDRYKSFTSFTAPFTHLLSGKFTKFPQERYINYQIVQTVQRNSAPDYLASPDPWMVSTTLFLARKEAVKLEPQAVVQRWEDRPDLWDDVTEEQALLYLSTLPAEVIRKLKIHNDDVRDVIQSHFKEKDNPLLLQCSFSVDRGSRIIFMDMSIAETEPYESLNRVEISLRDKNGKEFFRAMNNRMDHPAPIPPNAFGVYAVGSKKIWTDSDIVDAGHEASTLVKGKYGNLVDGCKTSTAQGILKIHWIVKVSNGALLSDKVFPFVKVVPRGENDAPWNFCASSIDNPSSAQPAKTRLTSVTPLLCFEENECGDADMITLVHLSRQKRKGIIKRWAEDTGFAYEFKEISREIIDVKSLPEHKLLLDPGFYRLEYNDVTGDPPAGFYGKSVIFEVKAGADMKIVVWVLSAL